MPDYRPVGAADLPAIRDLQIDSWRRTYRGMLPDRFLKDEVEGALGARWAAMPGAAWVVESVWNGSRLAGFIAVDTEVAGGAYVDNLHVADWAQGQGLGRALMVRAAQAVAARGIGAMWLTVMRDNPGSRAFYRRIGGIEGPEQTQDLCGQLVHCLPVRWNDLSELTDLGG